MKNTICIFFSLLLLNISACKTTGKSSSAGKDKERNYEAEGFVKAEVKEYNIDGCGFMLFLDETKKLNPASLDEKFKKEGLKVWVKYTIDKNRMSICMAGQNIIITEIAERK